MTSELHTAKLLNT